MSQILCETTKWSGDYVTCNHTYLLDNQNNIIAYIKYGTDQINVLKTRIKIDKRYRTFQNITHHGLSKLIPTTGAKSNTRVFTVKSNTKIYTVELKYSNYSCTCTGYNFRGKCKHIVAVAEKLQPNKIA